MASWISSKLKVAETFLQQIDQQAAESLGKNERPPSDEPSVETPSKSGGVVPLKDQLKKKTQQNNDYNGKLHSDPNFRRLNNRDRDKETVATPINLQPSLNSKSSLTDQDWTELLSAPKRLTPPAANRTNGVPVIRGLRKDGRRKGNSGSNLLAVEVKRNHKSNISVSKSAQRLDIESDSKVNGAVSDGKRSDVEESGFSDSMQRTSNAELGIDGDYVEGRDLGQKVGDAKLLVESKDKVSQERNGVCDIVGDGGKSDFKDVSLEDASRSIDESRPLEMGLVTVDGVSDRKMRVLDGRNGLSSTAVVAHESNAASGSSISDKMKISSSSVSYEGTDSDTGSASTSDSENEREREERRRRREQILAERAAAKAVEAIKERENMVARLEGEKQSLEKILEERAKQQAQEASELQTTTMETMEAVDLEKQKHNTTRMEALTRLAKLETANADLSRALATAQWNLVVEVNQVAELRQQIELKEVSHEELRARISNTSQMGSSLNQSVASKGVEFEQEILEAEYSFMTDKIKRLQDKAKKLEENIEMTRKEIENPTEVEVELKRRLGQLTDHLIQKQAQVEALSSEKATLLFRIEAVSRLLDENKPMLNIANSRFDLESGAWWLSNTKLRPSFEEKIRSGGQHLGSLLRQLDALFSAGALFLRRNSTARLWSFIYLVCLHLWVVYILMSPSQASNEAKSGAVISLENINNTAGI
ncbi:hypothetical protein L1049_028115 [Liquidambar formosana]|uniref:Golgin candidate 2 n=1 Tax=Liquidambar formosana TaxID=63359 RepID=A0AAP0WVW9_LIQFO